MLHQLSLLASAPADLGTGRDGRGGRLLSPTGSPVKRPSSRSSTRAVVDGLYPAAAAGRCAAVSGSGPASGLVPNTCHGLV